MPANIQIPETDAVVAFRSRSLVGRFGILREALFYQLDNRLLQTFGVLARSLPSDIIPGHGYQVGHRCRHTVMRLRHTVGVRYIGFDIEHWCAVEQVDT